MPFAWVRRFERPGQMNNFANVGGRGLVLAAPHSGSGKTVVTIGLMRALRRCGVTIAPAKIGPDYIDPQFHQIASGVPSLNLDGWAMRPETLDRFGGHMLEGGGFSVIEGVMGLFDGAVKPGVLGHGATADIAKFLGLPVVLIVDCAGMGQSVAALVKGFAGYDPKVEIAGVILNKLGSLRHVDMMRGALAEIGMKVVGAVPRSDDMVLPSRHLGLVQAGEHDDIEARIEAIADHIERHVDLPELVGAAGLMRRRVGNEAGVGIEPGGQHVAVARDEAFRFFYPHMETGWRQGQVTLSFFSPLEDEAPDENADAIFLPGGYPELFGGRLAAAGRFKAGVRQAAKAGKPVYGECGGYMVLGEGLVDKDGAGHEMIGLLKLETSFAKRKLHLGYRHVADEGGARFRGHEFHYATVGREAGTPLYHDVDGECRYGLRDKTVSGSFVHLIDNAA